MLGQTKFATDGEICDKVEIAIGCIGCPMGNGKGMIKEFERWPSYKKLYLKAFDRMLKARLESGLETNWKTAEEIMMWWLQLDKTE